jgi:uncharacterized membrane protein
MLNRVLTVAALAVGGMMLSKQLKKNRSASGAGSSVIESIDINVPVSIAYNQWTQFEEFPRFMDNVHEVRQLDDKHLHWRADVAGKEKEWDSEITEQIPDQRIAWHSITGPRNAGVATFHKISDNACRVTLQMDYEPQTLAEKAGDMLGAVRMQLRSDMKRFKELLESRGQETGAWRGTITH